MQVDTAVHCFGQYISWISTSPKESSLLSQLIIVCGTAINTRKCKETLFHTNVTAKISPQWIGLATDIGALV